MRYKIIKLIFIFFLNIINNTISYGMDIDLEEDINFHAANRSQFGEKTLLVDKDLYSSSGLQIELDNESNQRNSNSQISDSYVLAFQDDSEESTSKLLTFKYITSLVGGLGGSIPQIGVAIQVGKHYGSTALGYGLVGTTILGTGGITSWMIWELIEDSEKLVKTARQPQNDSNRCNVNIIKGVTIGALSLVLGALSSAPEVYKTYKYNQIKEMAILTFIYETIPRTLGFYKLFSSINLKKKNSICKKENIITNKGIEIIDSSKIYFLNVCKENGILSSSHTLKQSSTPSEIYAYLAPHLQQNLIEEVEETLPYCHAKGLPKKIARYAALIFPVGAACVDLILSYKGYNFLTNKPVFLFSLSGISVLPNLVLNSYVMNQVAGDLFDKIHSCNKLLPTDYFGAFHPKIKKIFLGVSLFLAASAVGGSVYFILDNLEGTFLSPAKYVFVALGATSNVTFGTYTIMNTLINFGEVITKKCNKGTSYVLSCLKKLDDVRHLIVNSSINLIKSFIGAIKPVPLTSEDD